MIKISKEKGLRITCEVCPHHLFLTEEDLPIGYREVRPCLSFSKSDCDALWSNMDYIDCFATDHGLNYIFKIFFQNKSMSIEEYINNWKNSKNF